MTARPRRRRLQGPHRPALFAAIIEEVRALDPTTLGNVLGLAKPFGNTMTSTLWRFAEQAQRPVVALVCGHPHPSRLKADFNPADPCRYCVQSFEFMTCFAAIQSYC
jgi:hypothetical protein